MWRKKALCASIVLAMIASIISLTSTYVYAQQVISKQVKEEIQIKMYETEPTLVTEETMVRETAATTEVAIIPEETIATEETIQSLTETVPEETEEVIVEETEEVTIDPLVITEIEVEDDGTRIMTFKNKLYRVPQIHKRTEPMVSKSGYVEKIINVPNYFQQSYLKTRYGNHGTVSSHGCGITSCAMVYSYLLDREILPDALAEKYGRFNGEHGSSYKLFTQSAEDLGLDVIQSHNWNEVEEALRNGCIVIANVRSSTIFTSGGHYIVYYGITEDDKVLINDPNIYNYGQTSKTPLSVGFREGFDLKYVKYSVPCWIYQPKDIERVCLNHDAM